MYQVMMLGISQYRIFLNMVDYLQFLHAFHFTPTTTCH